MDKAFIILSMGIGVDIAWCSFTWKKYEFNLYPSSTKLLLIAPAYRWTEYGSSASVDKHDDVIKWKHFPRHWPFVRGIHRSPVNSPHKDQWCGALMFSLICVWINGWINNRKAVDLRRYRAHYDVTVMLTGKLVFLAQFLFYLKSHGVKDMDK